jgi:hypothetical protein
MLAKIPPDWVIAENHGRANLACDPSKLNEVYDMNSDKFCHCCQHQIPGEEDFYPLDDNMVLGELGEGFPILFQLMKYINIVLFFAFLFFFVPAIVLIRKAIGKYGDKTAGEEPLSLHSFGAFLKYMDPGTLVIYSERSDYIIYYCMGMAAGIIVTMIFT